MADAGWFALATTGLVLLGGCGSMTTKEGTASLHNSAWVGVALAGKDFVGSKPTARFEGGRVHGTDGCNRYSAPYTTAGTTITVGPPGASTRMACAPDVFRQAEAFMAVLTAAKSFRVTDDRLHLLGADGTELATFIAQSQSLAGTSWRATAINNGKGGVSSLVADTRVTVTFFADGRVSGSGGCNNFTAGYQVDGNSLQFTPAAATRKKCAAAGVMEQEQAFLTALESVGTMRMEADRLELRTTAGALALMLVRAQNS